VKQTQVYRANARIVYEDELYYGMETEDTPLPKTSGPSVFLYAGG